MSTIPAAPERGASAVTHAPEAVTPVPGDEPGQRGGASWFMITSLRIAAPLVEGAAILNKPSRDSSDT